MDQRLDEELTKRFKRDILIRIVWNQKGYPDKTDDLILGSSSFYSSISQNIFFIFPLNSCLHHYHIYPAVKTMWFHKMRVTLRNDFLSTSEQIPRLEIQLSWYGQVRWHGFPRATFSGLVWCACNSSQSTCVEVDWSGIKLSSIPFHSNTCELKRIHMYPNKALRGD